MPIENCNTFALPSTCWLSYIVSFDVQRCSWWIVGGLGARGLVYHAWLGKLIAEAILQDSEDNLPSQLLRWKSPKQKQK